MSIRSSVTALALAAVICVPAGASAQTPTSVDAGIKGGVNFSTLHGDASEIGELKNLLGLTGGVFVGRNVNKNFGLQFEGLYSQRGAKNEESGANVEIRINYIDIPVLARFGGTSANGSRFHFLTGPTASLKLNAKVSGSVNGSTFSEDIDDDIENLDFGWTVGVGADIRRFIIDARYTLGLKNMDKTGEDAIKNRTFSFMVGYRLK